MLKIGYQHRQGEGIREEDFLRVEVDISPKTPRGDECNSVRAQCSPFTFGPRSEADLS